MTLNELDSFTLLSNQLLIRRMLSVDNVPEGVSENVGVLAVAVPRQNPAQPPPRPLTGGMAS